MIHYPLDEERATQVVRVTRDVTRMIIEEFSDGGIFFEASGVLTAVLAHFINATDMTLEMRDTFLEDFIRNVITYSDELKKRHEIQ